MTTKRADALTRGELVEAIRSVGILPGDVLLIQSDLIRMGPVAALPDREAILDFYVDAFREVLGVEGTMVVLTSFEDYGRYGVPFIRESSPSRSGVLSERIRMTEGAVRSEHPIVSLCALGPRAEEICGGPHRDGFGYASPWGRLHRSGAKVIQLGYGITSDGMTFLHYLEQLYGVPYQYTKIYTAPVWARGEIVPGPFTLAVRYLDLGVEYDQRRLKERLVSEGRARLLAVGRGALLATSCDEIVEVGVKALTEDRYSLLASTPRFRAGAIPMDGPTGPAPAA